MSYFDPPVENYRSTARMSAGDFMIQRNTQVIANENQVFKSENEEELKRYHEPDSLEDEEHLNRSIKSSEPNQMMSPKSLDSDLLDKSLEYGSFPRF
jgi:hypothetical protein